MNGRGGAAASIDPASYYADVTRQYGRYAGDARGWHYGLWDDGVTTHQEALVAANARLLDGLSLNEDSRVLDVGFGVGGFSTWLAETHGCRVTGITICRPHPPIARALAGARGVGRRCAFAVMDMDALGFAPASFDLVVNQETFCHAADKARYLQSVARVLKPGGHWRAICFARRDGPPAAADRAAYEAACAGFHMASFLAPSEVTALLARAGFVDVAAVDLTPLVGATARAIIRQCWAPSLLRRAGLDWLIFSRDAGRLANRRGHVSAALAYSRGLLGGAFRHVYYSGRLPLPGGSG